MMDVNENITQIKNKKTYFTVFAKKNDILITHIEIILTFSFLEI